MHRVLAPPLEVSFVHAPAKAAECNAVTQHTHTAPLQLGAGTGTLLLLGQGPKDLGALWTRMIPCFFPAGPMVSSDPQRAKLGKKAGYSDRCVPA